MCSQPCGAQRSPTLPASLCRNLRERGYLFQESFRERMQRRSVSRGNRVCKDQKRPSEETGRSRPRFLFFGNPGGRSEPRLMVKEIKVSSVPPPTNPMAGASSLNPSLSSGPKHSSFMRTSWILNCSKFSKIVPKMLNKSFNNYFGHVCQSRWRGLSPWQGLNKCF